MGAWIEITTLVYIHAVEEVAPFMGAWIEILCMSVEYLP